MKKLIFFIIFTLVLHTNTNCLVTIRGNDTAKPFGFTENIVTSTFDSITGSLFVGLESGANEYSISRAVRSNFSSTSKFVPIAKNVLTNASIEFLSHTREFLDQTISKTLLAAVEKGTNSFSANTITILASTGTPFTTTESINDSTGTMTTGGIVAIAQSPNISINQTTRSHIIAAVRPNNGNFGATGSGLALIEINSTSLITKITSQLKDALTGQDGNQANPLDASSVTITGGTVPVTFLDGTDENRMVIHYDEILDLFYVGVRIQTGTDADAIGKAIVIADITDNGILIKEVVPNTAITTAPTAQTHYIVAAQANAAQLKSFHIKTMHTSTNYDYLITNSLSSANNAQAVTNELYAVPLVYKPGTLDHGKIAKTDPTIQNGPFTEIATMPTDMVTSRSPAALIGGGPLPIESMTEIRQIEVVGDTVYVGLGNLPNESNSVGIFYSQAQFGPNGNIINWTQWAKRAAPITTFPSFESTSTRINFFHVDAATGNIWIGENTQKQNVAITSWTDDDTQEGSTTLLSALNDRLQNGCFSVLDLDSATRDFTNRQTGTFATIGRYALFGGYNEVVFAVTSIANGTGLPETVNLDYTQSEVIRTISLPAEAGAVTHLAYSKRTIVPACDTGTAIIPEFIPRNYFFAGSQNGLYVFAQPNGQGFESSTLAGFDQAPFSNGQWLKFPQFTDPIIDLKSDGNALYVLTSSFTQEKPFVDKLFVIPFDQPSENISEFFAANGSYLIAQTGVEIFSDVTHFKEVAIIATDKDQDIPVNITANIIVDQKEQIILATSNGLFATNAIQTNENACNSNQGSPDPINQTNANWSLVENSQNIQFLGIASTDSPIHHTAWPFSLLDPLQCNIFNAGTIHQISGSENPIFINDESRGQSSEIGSFKPNNFASNGNIISTDEIITAFWTDGGRRFFIMQNFQNFQQNYLGTFAFNIQKFPPLPSPIISHPILEKQKQFFWISPIGRQGKIFAGTNNGIISLQ